MRLLIVNTNVMVTDGITNVIRNLFGAMDKADLHVDLVAINEPPESVRTLFEAEGGSVHVLPRSMKKLTGYISALIRVIKKGKYDAVHVHGSSATLALEMVAAWLAGCKVRIAHSHNTTCKSMTVHRLMTPVFRALCTHRLACGEAAGRWLYGKKEFTVVNNGINTAWFAFSAEARNRIRQQYGFTDDQKIIGHVGIFNEAKNQGFLIDLLSCLNEEYRLLLLGEGSLRKAVEEKVTVMGLTDRVVFAGVTDRVPDYLSACDLIVMPSLYEGLPLALIEQQTNGLQCIVSENITREADKTGNLTFLSLGAGVESWADAVRALSVSGDREERSRIAIEKITENGYDIRTEAEKLKEFYWKVVGR